MEVAVLQSTGNQDTAAQGIVKQYLITPRTLVSEEEAGPSNRIQQEEPTASDDETIANIMLNISRSRGTSIPVVDQSQALQSSSQPTQEADPNDRGKGIMVESKKKNKKFTLADLRVIEIAKNEEAARRMQAELDAEAEKSKYSVDQPRSAKTIAQ